MFVIVIHSVIYKAELILNLKTIFKPHTYFSKYSGVSRDRVFLSLRKISNHKFSYPGRFVQVHFGGFVAILAKKRSFVCCTINNNFFVRIATKLVRNCLRLGYS